MRLAIVADIHGNWQALQAVLSDIAGQDVAGIFSLGDNIGYGPEPEEVVQALLAHQVVSVMGNHELALVSRSYYNRLHQTARTSLDITRSLLSDRGRVWLASLPPSRASHGARFVHGCPPQSMTVYLFSPSINRLQRVFASFPEPVCFAGHTHTLNIYHSDSGGVSCGHLAEGKRQLERQSRYIIMAGSVGQPRDPLNWHAKYLLWQPEDQTVVVRSVPYDVQTTVRLLGERGFPVTNAKRLVW